MNLSHPDGASKARYFIAAGFTPAKWQILADAIRAMPLRSSVTSVTTTTHGEIDTPNGPRGPIRTVWIIDVVPPIRAW